jgi:hypothetical protein
MMSKVAACLEHRARSGGRGHALDCKALGTEAGHDAAGDQFVVFTDQYVHAEPFMKDGGIKSAAD